MFNEKNYFKADLLPELVEPGRAMFASVVGGKINEKF
jgi:hypothetical protein